MAPHEDEFDAIARHYRRTTAHPLVSQAMTLVDLAADNLRTTAGLCSQGLATIDALLEAAEAYRAADNELQQLLALRLTVNGRTYTLRRPDDVRGEA